MGQGPRTLLEQDGILGGREHQHGRGARPAAVPQRMSREPPSQVLPGLQVVEVAESGNAHEAPRRRARSARLEFPPGRDDAAGRADDHAGVSRDEFDAQRQPSDFADIAGGIRPGSSHRGQAVQGLSEGGRPGRGRGGERRDMEGTVRAVGFLHRVSLLFEPVHRRADAAGCTGLGRIRGEQVEETGIGHAGTVPAAVKDSALAEKVRCVRRRSNGAADSCPTRQFDNLLYRISRGHASNEGRSA
mmetsp:Transcript_21768/g.52634  ORF Transcript_21768/g.52634 Transcript_21768/m.52634 type:complete len:245 (+) Transcript_21768:777-1511(+)